MLLDDLLFQAARLIRTEQFGLQKLQQLNKGTRNAYSIQNLFMIEIERENSKRGDLPFEEFQSSDGVSFHNYFETRCEISGSDFSPLR